MQEKTTFKQITCSICSQLVSTGGAAYAAHMRSHVRKGEATEYKQGKHLKFIATAEQSKFIEAQPYALLGEDPLPGQPKGVWQLPEIRKDLPDISPAAYFITSGDGLKKAEKMVKDVYSLAVKVRSFRDKLKRAKGTKKYLETQWENGRLLIKIKMPRKRPPEAEHD